MTRQILFNLSLFVVIGCGHRLSTTEPHAISWQEISDDQLVTPPKESWSEHYWSRFRQLPVGILRNPKVAKLAALRGLRHVQPFDLGVWGKRDGAGLFAATADQIPTNQRLYWVMVRTLSEKYGCFMRERRSYANVNYFRCRDRRHVVFWQNRGHEWVEFVGKQYNANGDEIRVSNHIPTLTGRRLAQDVLAHIPSWGAKQSPR